MAEFIIPSKLLAASVAIFILAGCGDIIPPAGHTTNQIEKDQRDCGFEATRSTSGDQSDGVDWLNVRNSCLQVRGYKFT